MMDLLGAGNPYMARRFAEGGEAQPAAPSRPQTYQQFIEQAVMRDPEYANIVEDYRFLTSDAVRQYRDQAYLEAEKKMQAELPGLIERQRQQELQRLTDEMFTKRAGERLQTQQSILAATKPGDRFEYGAGKYTKMGYTVLPDGRLMGDNQTIYTAEDRQRMLDDIDQQLAAQRRTVEMLAPREFKNISSGISNQVAEAYQRDVYEPFAQQRYQELIPRKTNLPFNQMNARTAEIAGQYYGGLPESYYDQLRREPEEMEQAYLRQMEGLPTGETEESYARRMYAIQNMQNEQAAKKQAYEAKLNYLYSPQFDFAKGPGQLDAVYEEAFRQAMSQYPSLTPPSLVPTGSPTGQAASAPAPTPSTPSAPVVPQPVLPGYTTQQPGIPVSNLTPRPMPGGIPQPGIGSLPAYQTPTAQAQQPMQQQQIQYGPIGQAATSSSDLLKNLLAATQQSSPYDFTKNNPYLMENQPVQFFAEGGEVKPPAQPVANVHLSWFRDPTARMSEPEFKRGVEAYGSVSAFKSAIEKYERDYAQYVIDFAKNQFSKGQYGPGAVASAYERAASSPLFSSGERENFLAKAATFNMQQQQLDEANAAQRAAQDLVISRFQAFNPLEQELTKKAYEEYENRKNYFQGLFQQQKQDLLQQRLNRTGFTDKAAYSREIDRLSGLDDIEMAAAREALDKNLAFIRNTREQMRLGDVDTSNLMLPYLFTKPEPVPVQEPPPTLVPTTPTTPTTPVPVETAPAPSPIPAPVIGQQPSLPAPTIPTAPQIPISNLTPQPMPGITAPPSIGGIPQPGMGIFASQQNPLYQSILPTYQTPQAQAPSTTQQQPQMQIQYGPIGQGAVGQTNLLNTLLANQQDPTKVSLLGFDNPYLMKPFG